MADDPLVKRLKRLEEKLARVFADTIELRDAVTQPDHPLNDWPHRERRATSRPSTPSDADASPS